MQRISLQQPYDELTALECLLLDGSKRVQHAAQLGLLSFAKKDRLHVVGSGFSAVLAYHALRGYARPSGVHDPRESLPADSVPGAAILPMKDLSEIGDVPVVVAAAPGNVARIMAQVDGIVTPSVQKILLFAPDDSRNDVFVDRETGWLHLNMSYRCVNMAVNMARRYRPVYSDHPVATWIMGTGLAGLLARQGLALAGLEFAGYAAAPEDAEGHGAGCDLLVTAAPQTFVGREDELSKGFEGRTAQFLFRQGDDQIPALGINGFTSFRLLGGGEEGMVFEGVSPEGQPCCYKKYYSPQDQTRLLDWTRSFTDAAPCLSWLGAVKPVLNGGVMHGVSFPYEKLAHIPFLDEGTEAALRATVPYCLEVQEEYVRRGVVPTTMPGGIHAMCNESGSLRFIDVGNLPPKLAECPPAELKRYVVKGLAGLTHETIFPGKGWSGLESEKNTEAILARLDEKGSLFPGWYGDLLREVIGSPAEVFASPETYATLRQKYSVSDPTLSRELAERAHAPILGVPPAPSVERHGRSWYRECQYQSFFYRDGAVEGFGLTGDKYALIRDAFEQTVAGGSYLDIGSNRGFFVARAALVSDRQCVGIEKKAELRLQAQRMFRAVGLDNAEVVNATFALGHPLPECDVVSAFAIIHHLYLMDGSFPRLTDLVHHLAVAAKRALFIEYAHNPGYLERAEARHGRSFDDYTEEGLVDALRQHFDSVEKLAEVSDSRAVYLASHKDPS